MPTALAAAIARPSGLQASLLIGASKEAAPKSSPSPSFCNNQIAIEPSLEPEASRIPLGAKAKLDIHKNAFKDLVIQFKQETESRNAALAFLYDYEAPGGMKELLADFEKDFIVSIKIGIFCDASRIIRDLCMIMFCPLALTAGFFELRYRIASYVNLLYSSNSVAVNSIKCG